MPVKTLHNPKPSLAEAIKIFNNKKLLIILLISLLVLSACEKKTAINPDYENLKRAESFITQGNLSTARIELLNALQIDASNPQTFSLLSELYQTLGLYKKAAEELIKAQSLNGDTSVAMQLKIFRLLIMGGDSSAIAQLKKLQALNLEQEQEKQVLLGRAYLINKDFQTARHQFNQVISTRNPFNAEAYLGLANIAQNTDSIEQTIGLLDKSLQANPDYVDALLARGQLYLQTGDNIKAENFYTKAMMGLKQLDVMTARKYIALSGLVEALNRQNKTQQALQYSAILAKSRPGKLKSSYESALTALADQDIKKAKVNLEEVLDIAPTHQQSNYLVGMLEIKEGDLVSAEKHLSQALAGELVSDQIRTALIITRLKLKQFAKAETLIADGLKTDPESPAYLTLEGAYFAAINEPQKAETALLAALSKNVNFLPAISELAKLYGSENNLEKAEEYIDRGMKVAPDNVELLMAKIQYAKANGNLNQTKAYLLNLHRSKPDLIAPPLVLASTYLSEGNLNLATNYLERVIAINPKHPLIANLKSNILMTKATQAIAEGKFKSALTFLDQSLAEQAKNIRANILKASLLSRQGDAKAALAISKSLQSDPKTRLIGYEMTGNILAQQAQFKQAAEAYDTVWKTEKNPKLGFKIYKIKKEYSDSTTATEHLENWLNSEPNNFYAITSLAAASSENEDFVKTTMLYEKALQINKDNPVVLNNLAYAYDKLGDPKALAAAEQAYHLAEQNPAIADTYGWILVTNNLLEKALPILAKAAKRAPTNKEILQHYSVALTKAGDEEKAREVMKQITELDSDNY